MLKLVFLSILLLNTAYAEFAIDLSSIFTEKKELIINFQGPETYALENNQIYNNKSEREKQLLKEVPLSTIYYRGKNSTDYIVFRDKFLSKRWPLTKVRNKNIYHLSKVVLEDRYLRKRSTIKVLTQLNQNINVNIRLPQLGGSFFSITPSHSKEQFQISQKEIRKINAYEYPFFHQEKSHHKVALITRGDLALATRIKMIQSAKKSIFLEYFVFTISHLSTQLILKELIKKAKAGLDIKILVDDAPFANNSDPHLTTILRNAGIELRIYNPSVDFSIRQFRNHRKFLIIDNKEFIAGGRNIDDQYFGMGQEYNLIDTDLRVKGNMTKTVTKSFFEYWNSRFTVLAPIANLPKNLDQLYTTPSSSQNSYEDDLRNYKKSIREWKKVLNTPKVLALKNMMNTLTKTLKKIKWFNIKNIQLVTDRPTRSEDSRILAPYLRNLIRKTKRSLYIQAPYFLPIGKEKYLFENLSKNLATFKVITNSRESVPDEIISVGKIIESNAASLIRKGANIVARGGDSIPEDNLIFKRNHRTRWQLHAKTLIADNISIISTYNFDPRSRDFNSENALIIKGNKLFQKKLKQTMDQRAKSSYKINSNGIFTGSRYYNNSPKILFRDKRAGNDFQTFILNLFGKEFL